MLKTCPTQSDRTFTPAYLNLLENGELAQREALAYHHLEHCDLCPRCCHVNRYQTNKTGFCHTGDRVVVYSGGAHYGEEAPLRGYNGSGTIFLSWCNLGCVYCQNWDISHQGMGHTIQPITLANMMLELQAQGCHNINIVSPSHAIAPIIAAVNSAAQQGLRLPLVYNTGGYDSLTALALLDGIVDIYMPDMKYGDSDVALKYSQAANYVEVNQAAVKEMHRQVGDLVCNQQGIAERGLLVRHLVLPENLAGTDKVLAFIAQDISANTYLNLMDQYYPCYCAHQYPPLNRRITREEYRQALELAHQNGLTHLA
jgi:putative pyruvate formate lyase activating enzyme